MLGHRLVTKQTGAHGRPCNKVMVAEKLSIEREFYFALVMDRAFHVCVCVCVCACMRACVRVKGAVIYNCRPTPGPSPWGQRLNSTYVCMSQKAVIDIDLPPTLPLTRSIAYMYASV